MVTQNDLSLAIIQATHAHAGQVDRGGQLYIFHPLRVMMKVQSLEAKVVAVLHDTVEDTSLTLDDIRKSFGVYIADCVDSVSRRKDESYKDFIKRSYMNPIGREVKIADIKDNLDITRPGSIEFLSGGICKRYYEALLFLEGKTNEIPNYST